MCVYSMVMDFYGDSWRYRWDKFQQTHPIQPAIFPPQTPITDDEISELRKLLEKAREYDKKNNEPDCELEEKKKKLMELAKEMGIEDKVNFL